MVRTNLKTIALSVAAAIVAAMLGESGAWAARAINVPGEQRRWALHFRVRLEQPGGESPVGIDLSGVWVATVSAVRAGEYDAALQIADLRLSGDGDRNPSADATNQLRRRLARPFWVTYRSDGALLAVHFFKDVDPSDANLLQMIATEAQFVCPDLSRPLWTVLERDAAGSYLAIYQRSEPGVVVKRKLKYVHTDGVAGAPADALQVAVDQSEFHFSLDSADRVIALDGNDRVKIALLGPQAGPLAVRPLAATAEIHLTNLRRGRALEVIGSLSRARPDVLSFPIVTHQPDPAQVQARSDDLLLEHRTTESLLEAAMAKDADAMLPDRLAALFRRRPQAVTAALALLWKAAPQKRITDALAFASSPGAIEALGSLARDRAMTSAARVDALSALFQVQHPGPDSMRIPVALLDDGDARVQSAARMVSGALARAGRSEHATEANAIDAALIARYRKPQEVRDACDLLAGLGNSVGPSTLPVIGDALSDPRTPVRAAAARALRLATGPEIDRWLSAAIASDADPGVRADAIFAGGFHHPLGLRLVDALLQVARGDSVDYVRSNAITLLRRNPDASPDIAKTLAWVANNDPKPGIRRLAREALGTSASR
jgi:hypothetical protein